MLGGGAGIRDKGPETMSTLLYLAGKIPLHSATGVQRVRNACLRRGCGGGGGWLVGWLDWRGV